MGNATPTEMRADVVVVGAGIAGLSAAIVLARAGRSVLCVDPDPPPRIRVGESLDWAAPSLLEKVGLPHHRIVEAGIGTRKRDVHGIATSGSRLVGRTEPWMARWPLKFQIDTIHVDRERFDIALYEEALAVGVRFSEDAVTHVVCQGDSVVSCETRSGARLVARWYLDASGRARLFARAMGIGRRNHASSRVALWTHREVPQTVEGTVLHLDDGPADLRWAWEIPVSADSASVGVVIPGTEFKRRRGDGADPDEVFGQVSAGFAELARRGPADVAPVHLRSFRSYTHERAAGANWMMVGEAAAFVDPLTSTGLSAALRHGTEAAEIILSGPPDTSTRALRRFDRRVRALASLYNEAIEAFMYSPDVRREVGVRRATQVYVIFGFGMSAYYTRVGGTGPVRHVAVMAAARAVQLWLRHWRRSVERRRSRLSRVDRSSTRPLHSRPT